MKPKTNFFNQFKFSSAVKDKMFARMMKEKKRITLDVFEKETKISKATLSRIENGAPPDVETFCKLLKWLDKPASEFFNDKSETNKTK